MSSFVLCDDSDWKELYEEERHKYFRLQEASDLLGHPSIRVYIHEDWMGSYPDDRTEYLEQQIETLAVFGYIKLIYKYNEGKEEVFKVEPVKIIENPQMDMFESTPSVAVYEKEDEDCAGGSCKI